MSLIETIALVEVETADLSAIPTINTPGPRVNSAFSKINPSLQLAWDSTSLGAMKTCPKYYDYAIRQGYRARGTSVHLTFGIEFHAGLELYDRLRAEGKDHHYAMLETVRSVFIRTWDSRLGRPWISDDPNKNRETLIRTIVWYLDHFADDPLETIIRSDGQPCVELSFRMELDLQSTSTGEGYLLCGHIDRLAKFQGKPWIVDRKTSKWALGPEYFAGYSPDNQMSLYDLAGTMIYPEPIQGIIIDAAQVGVTYSRFQRGFTARTPSQREEWLSDTEMWLRMAEVYAIQNHWPRNDKNCKQFGRDCDYRPVCSAQPEIRQQLLDSLYTRFTWDPLQVREA